MLDLLDCLLMHAHVCHHEYANANGIASCANQLWPPTEFESDSDFDSDSYSDFFSECEAVKPAEIHGICICQESLAIVSVQLGAQQAQTIVGKVIQKSCDYCRLGKCNEKELQKLPNNKPSQAKSHAFADSRATNLLASFPSVTSFHFAS